MKISISEIKVKTNLRKEFDSTEMENLKDSLRDRGQLQPILVTKIENAYILIAGERRLRAAKELGWQNIECHVKDYGAGNGDSLERVNDSIFENLRRSPYNNKETAKALEWLEKHWKTTGEVTTKKHTGRKSVSKNKAPKEPSFAEKASKETGMGKSTIKRKLRIEKYASDKVKAALANSEITEKKAEQLVRLEDRPLQEEALKQSSDMDAKGTAALVDRFLGRPNEQPIRNKKQKPKGDSAKQLRMNTEADTATVELYSVFSNAERKLEDMVDNRFWETSPEEISPVRNLLTAFADKITEVLEQLDSCSADGAASLMEVENDLH